MSKNCLLTSLLSILYSQSFSQTLIEFNSGYGTFLMTEMERFQERIVDSENLVPISITESFPAYYSYEFGINRDYNRQNFGIRFNYSSSGGRLSYEDYSGSVRADQILKRYAVGINGTFYKKRLSESFQFWIRTTVYFHKTRLLLENELKLGNIVESESTKFNSMGFSAVPIFEFKYMLFSFCSLNAQIGFSYNFYGKDFSLADNGELFLVDRLGSLIKPDWSGVRVGGGVTFFLFRNRTEGYAPI